MNIGWPTSLKEWKFFVAIVVLLEFLFLHFVYMASDNKNLVNLFAFGATLTSIILAITAIFYSFLQTEAQKEDSRYLASQLQSLGGLTEKLGDSSSRVNSSISNMEDFFERLKNLASEVALSRKDLANLDQKLTDFTSTNKTASAAPTADNSSSIAKALESFLSSAVDEVKLFIYACYLSHKHNKLIEPKELIQKHYIEPWEKADPEQAHEEVRKLNLGFGFGVLLSIAGFGIGGKIKDVPLPAASENVLSDYFKNGVPTMDDMTKEIALAIEQSFENNA